LEKYDNVKKDMKDISGKKEVLQDKIRELADRL